MPVSVTITVADPPAAPAGYCLVGFEVRTCASGGAIAPIAIFAGTTEGFEDAANILVKAVSAALSDVGIGLRLAAVAWWADKPLADCVDGRERLVSVCDAANGRWGEWIPEQRIGEPEKASRNRQPWTRANLKSGRHLTRVSSLHDNE